MKVPSHNTVMMKSNILMQVFSGRLSEKKVQCFICQKSGMFIFCSKLKKQQQQIMYKIRILLIVQCGCTVIVI